MSCIKTQRQRLETDPKMARLAEGILDLEANGDGAKEDSTAILENQDLRGRQQQCAKKGERPRRTGREPGGDQKGPCHRNQSKTASRGVSLKDQVFAQGPRVERLRFWQ